MSSPSQPDQQPPLSGVAHGPAAPGPEASQLTTTSTIGSHARTLWNWTTRHLRAVPVNWHVRPVKPLGKENSDACMR